MKLSELIKQAQALQTKHGDLEVGALTDLGCDSVLFTPITKVSTAKTAHSNRYAPKALYLSERGQTNVAVLS